MVDERTEPHGKEHELSSEGYLDNLSLDTHGETGTAHNRDRWWR